MSARALDRATSIVGASLLAVGVTLTLGACAIAICLIGGGLVVAIELAGRVLK